MKRSALIHGLSLSFLCASLAAAQPLESPKKFYERGYVHEGSRDHATPKPTVARSQGMAPGEQETPVASATPVGEPSAVNPPPASTATAAPIAGDGERILSLSLLVAAHDPEHFAKVYQEYLDNSQRLKLPVRDVFLIGDPQPIFNTKALSRFEEHAIKPVIRYADSVPEPFRNAHSSPTLVVETRAGVVLLEGYRSLLEFFNERGEFVAPRSSSPVDATER